MGGADGTHDGIKKYIHHYAESSWKEAKSQRLQNNIRNSKVSIMWTGQQLGSLGASKVHV
jgi:hypothetical protein